MLCTCQSTVLVHCRSTISGVVCCLFKYGGKPKTGLRKLSFCESKHTSIPSQRSRNSYGRHKKKTLAYQNGVKCTNMGGNKRKGNCHTHSQNNCKWSRKASACYNSLAYPDDRHNSIVCTRSESVEPPDSQKLNIYKIYILFNQPKQQTNHKTTHHAHTTTAHTQHSHHTIAPVCVSFCG